MGDLVARTRSARAGERQCSHALSVPLVNGHILGHENAND
jgi:hypothetical protein